MCVCARLKITKFQTVSDSDYQIMVDEMVKVGEYPLMAVPIAEEFAGALVRVQ